MYGSAIKTFPVKKGDIWTAGANRFLCDDTVLTDKIDKLIPGGQVDCIYTDPPWNPGNQRMFHTFAKSVPPYDYSYFLSRFIDICIERCPTGYIFFEMGIKWQERFEKWITGKGLYILARNVTYYRSGKDWAPCGLICASTLKDTLFIPIIPDDLQGDKAIRWIFNFLSGQGYRTVFDPCCGKMHGLSFASRRGMQTYGIELIPEKLAKGLAAFSKMGYDISHE